MNSSRPRLILRRFAYEEPQVTRFVLDATNGRYCGLVEFYSSADGVSKLGALIEPFPGHIPDEVLWEVGSEGPGTVSAYHLRLRLFTTDLVGHCAIEFQMNNNRAPPRRERVEFCIPAEAAQICRLGRLLREFGESGGEVLFWDLENGNVFDSYVEFEREVIASEE